MPDLNQQLFQQLSKFAFAPVSRTNDFDIAYKIFLNSTLDLKSVISPSAMQEAPKKEGGGGPSTFSRIIDVLSRPLYGTANVAKSAVEHANEPFSLEGLKGLAGLSGVGLLANPVDAWKGVSGQDKTTTRDLKAEVENQGIDIPKPLESGVGGFLTSLAGDIALDPLSMLGPGTVKAGTQAGYKMLGKEAPKWTMPKVSTVAPERFPMPELPSAMKNMAGQLPKEMPFPQIGAGKTGKLTDAKAQASFLKALEDAPAVSMSLDELTKRTAIAEQALSPQQLALFNKKTIDEGKTILGGMEASKPAIKTFKELSKDITYQSRGPLQHAVDQNASALETVVRGPQTRVNGRFGPKPITRTKTFSKKLSGPSTAGVIYNYNQSVTKALNQLLDEPVTTLKPGETVSEKGVKHSIMARIATNAGQKDIRPLVLDQMSSAKARAGARIKDWENTLKGFDDAQVKEAWDLARNAVPRQLASDPKVSKLADDITGGMENFFRSRAIPENVAKGNSVALRSGMVMADINKMLKRYNVPFQFTKGTATDPITHSPISYEDGTNWLISWESKGMKDANEVKQFIYGVQHAAEQLSAEYALLDDLAARFGSRFKGAGKTVKVKEARLGDYYFSPELGDQISLALKGMRDLYTPTSPVSKFIAGAVSKWKAGVTKYHPRHHVTNAIGDTFLMWMAGVNNPRVFSKSLQVLRANGAQYKGAGLEDLVGMDAVKKSIDAPGKTVIKNRSGREFTARELYVSAFNYGLLQKSHVIEDIATKGQLKPLGGKVSGAFDKVSELREHYIKMAHFIDVVQKSSGKNPKAIFEEAAHEVRKWHPDGLDLTKQEQMARTLLIPFYSWTRKSIPLLAEGALMSPMKAFTAYPKTQYALQDALGIEGTELSDPFPEDQLFPKWMRDEGIGPLGKTGMPGIGGLIGKLGRQSSDQDGNPIDAYTLLGPATPMTETFGSFGGFSPEGMKKGLLGMLGPQARIPIETMLTGEVTHTGQPLYGNNRKDTSDYATEQVPILSQLYRMTNLSPFGETKRQGTEGIGNREAFLNWATGAGLVGTGPFIKHAEFEDIDSKKGENKKYREFANEIGYPIKKNGKVPDWIKQLYAERSR